MFQLQIKIKYCNTFYFSAKSEIPSSQVNGMLALQAQNGLNINLSWDSSTGILSSVYPVLTSNLVEEIK